MANRGKAPWPASADVSLDEDSAPPDRMPQAAQEVGRTVTIPRQKDPTSASGGSALLRSKLGVPRLPPGVVPRARLLDRVTAGAAQRVTLVSAGPGWGKTTLVAAWASDRQSTEPVAWLSLDSFDNDPVLFWSHLAAAIHGTGEVSDGSLGALMIRPPVGEDVVRRILLALAELPRPLTLVLDDFGEINNPQVLDGVSDLVRHPSPLRLVVVTRSDPSLHLHRLRVGGELLEIRAADLAFTEQESGALLRQAGVALPGDLTRRLRDRTEGWAVGLRLAALFAAGSADPERIEEFADADTGVADYLAEELLAALPEERRRFLVRTSIASRLCADLADLLSGGTGAQKELEALERSNAFVMAVGADREWFRYHPLLADVLRHRLHVDEPELAPELHRRAAHWFAARGEAVEAVRHAVGAADWQLVGQLMVSGAAIRAVSAERQAFAALLEQVPSTMFDSSAELQVTAAVRCFIARDYAGFANHAAHARAMVSQRDEVDRRPVEAFLLVADMVASRMGGDVPALLVSSTQLLDWLSGPLMSGTPAAALYEAPALSNLGVALVWSARTDEAEEPLRSSLSIAADSGVALTTVNSLGYLAWTELERGHLHAAHAIASQGREAAEHRGWTEQVQTIAIYLVLAQIELEWNRPQRAQLLLDAGLAAQRNDPETLAYPALQAVQASIWLARGRGDRAREVLADLHLEAELPALPPLLRRLLAMVAADIEVAAGHAQAAINLADGQLTRDQGALRLRLRQAQARIALGDPAAVEADLAAVRDISDNPVVIAEAWLITAIAADHHRDDHRAMAALERALVLAEPENLRRPFVALGDHRVEAMLRRRSSVSAAGDDTVRLFAAQILDEVDPAALGRQVRTPLAEPLTDRELDVLSYMGTLQTNEEIAADLFISINTVKAHARSVYRKLGVSNRRGAVKRARELGLA
jgi:LuxR family transcriptional regulator, maltose regulon positive regulatory protein